MTTKTINTWNKTLVDLGMIARIDDNHLSKSTILLPLSSYYKLALDSSLKDVTESTVHEIDGNLVAVYHLFEWRKMRLMKIITFLITHSVVFLKEKHKRYYL